MLDFKYGKILGADYVISRFPITHKDLKMICYKCNNSKHIFLYLISFGKKILKLSWPPVL